MKTRSTSWECHTCGILLDYIGVISPARQLCPCVTQNCSSCDQPAVVIEFSSPVWNSVEPTHSRYCCLNHLPIGFTRKLLTKNEKKNQTNINCSTLEPVPHSSGLANGGHNTRTKITLRPFEEALKFKKEFKGKAIDAPLAINLSEWYNPPSEKLLEDINKEVEAKIPRSDELNRLIAHYPRYFCFSTVSVICNSCDRACKINERMWPLYGLTSYCPSCSSSIISGRITE